MRKDAVTVEPDGIYKVTGGGWFWVRIQRTALGLAVIEKAPGMEAKTACRDFVRRAKATVEKYFGEAN